MKKIVVILASFFVICNASAYASEATHRAAAEEMVRLAKVDQLLTSMYKEINVTIDALVNMKDMSAEERERAGKFSKKMVAIMAEEMSWDKMKDDFVAVYMKTYTEAEIRQINDFYRTPAGQAMINKMPELVKESTTISQKYAMKMLERMQQEIGELEKETKDK